MGKNLCSYCGENTVYAKGLCQACYQRQRRGTLVRKHMKNGKKCAYCGATPVVAKGLCMACYQRQRRYGTLTYYKDRPRKYSSDIVDALKKQYPKFSKVALCMIRNPEYGVDLSVEAKKFLKEMEKHDNQKEASS